MEISLAESQTDSYFPTKRPTGYPKQKGVSDTHIQRRTITKINHYRRAALERSVMKSISLVGGLESILRGHNPRPYFCRGFFLLFGALWFILRGVLFYVFPCAILFLCFQPFSIAITSLWDERANLSAFRMFDRFVRVWICRFPLPLDVWEELRFVIVALPGLFSYLTLFLFRHITCSVRMKAF